MRYLHSSKPNRYDGEYGYNYDDNYYDHDNNTACKDNNVQNYDSNNIIQQKINY